MGEVLRRQIAELVCASRDARGRLGSRNGSVERAQRELVSLLRVVGVSVGSGTGSGWGGEVAIAQQ